MCSVWCTCLRQSSRRSTTEWCGGQNCRRRPAPGASSPGTFLLLCSSPQRCLLADRPPLPFLQSLQYIPLLDTLNVSMAK
jgi:hypothetical protein